jgi:hypothetical protein
MNVKDIHGHRVKVGDLVRIVSLRPSVLERLSPKDQEHLFEMQAATLSVYEIDEWGGAWVTMSWDAGDDRFVSHSIALASHEMELVSSSGSHSSS